MLGDSTRANCGQAGTEKMGPLLTLLLLITLSTSASPQIHPAATRSRPHNIPNCAGASGLSDRDRTARPRPFFHTLAAALPRRMKKQHCGESRHQSGQNYAEISWRQVGAHRGFHWLPVGPVRPWVAPLQAFKMPCAAVLCLLRPWMFSQRQRKFWCQYYRLYFTNFCRHSQYVNIFL